MIQLYQWKISESVEKFDRLVIEDLFLVDGVLIDLVDGTVNLAYFPALDEQATKSYFFRAGK